MFNIPLVFTSLPTSLPHTLHALYHQYSKITVTVHDGQLEWDLLLIVFGHSLCIMVQQTPPNIHKPSQSCQVQWSVAIRASSGHNGPTLKQPDHKLFSLIMYIMLHLSGDTLALYVFILYVTYTGLEYPMTCGIVHPHTW